MSRPYDWHPLCGGDPVPGDPWEVQSLSQRYLTTAEEIELQVSRLTGLARLDWEGDSGDAFRDASHEAGEKLEKAKDRYYTAGSALSRWVAPLSSAQDDTASLLRRAQDLEWSGRLVEPVREVLTAPTPEQQKAADDQYALALRRWHEAKAELASLQKSVHTITTQLNETAKGLARQIREVIDHDGLKDSRWQRFKGWVHDHAPLLKAIAEVCSWIATALCVIALFIPGLNLLVIGIALAFMTITLACHTALAVSGEGSWLDVGLDVVNMLLVGIPAFKLAKAAGKLGGAATTAAKDGEQLAGMAAKGKELGSEAGRTMRSGATHELRSDAAKTLNALKNHRVLPAQLEEGAARAAKLGEDLEHAGAQGLKLAGKRVFYADKDLADVVAQARVITHGRLAGSVAAKQAEALAIRAGRLGRTGEALDGVRHIDETGKHFGKGFIPEIPALEFEFGGEW